MSAANGLATRRLLVADLARLAGVGVRTRKLRAALSALGIAIGVAAIVAVLGLSSSSQAGLLAEIDQLGTNLLVVTNGQTFFGETAELPKAAPGMISRIGPVTDVQYTAATSANAYRTPLIPSINTNALTVQASSLGLPRAVDSSVLVGFPAAERYLGLDGHPSTVYVRSRTDQVNAVHGVLAATANTEASNEVEVSQPSNALVARARAKSALNSLFLGLGAVSLLVGAIGVANIMLISVLERRSEIGLRRALGATKSHIRIQFLAEAVLLALLGGAIGIGAGAAATAVYAGTKGWSVVVPTIAWVGGFGAALLIGAVAGLLPALRAARMSPTEALWT